MSKKKKEENSVRKQDLLKLINETNRKYKDPNLVKFAKDEDDPTRTLFGIETLDKLTGGMPSKRFNIIWGSKGVGKTTLALMLIAEAQKKGKLALYINQEGTFDKGRATLHGVDLNNLVIAGPFDNAEQAMDTLIEACKAKVVDLIVLDSIQAMSPQGEQETKKGKEKSMADDEMALLARKLSKFFRISTSGVYKGDVTVILIGQSRIGLGSFIALETLSGGHALQHWSTITLQLRRGAKSEAPSERVELEELDEDGKKIKVEIIRGFQSIIKLEKTKISFTEPEGSEIRLPYYFASGFKKVENEPIPN